MKSEDLVFFHELCQRSLQNPDDIGMAVSLIAEMNSAIKEGRPINPLFLPALEQLLALNDVLKVQQIEWFPRNA